MNEKSLCQSESQEGENQRNKYLNLILWSPVGVSHWLEPSGSQRAKDVGAVPRDQCPWTHSREKAGKGVWRTNEKDAASSLS